MLDVQDIVTAYGKIEALKGVSLAAAEGRITCLLGPNGAGKTTLMYSIAGVLKPRRGTIKLAGIDITGQSPAAIVARGLALVPENRLVFPQMSVVENLEAGAYQRRDSAEVAADIERMFARVGALTDEELTIVRLVVREALVSSSRLDRLMERFRRGHVALILKTVFDGFQSGTFDRNVNPVGVALSLVSLAGPAQLIRRFAAERLPIQGAPSGEALSRELVSALFDGVGAKPRES